MLRVAVLGTGFIASIFMKNIGAVAGIEVASVLAINDQEGQAFIQKHKVATYALHYDDLLNDPTIDCVYVGLPNHLHFPFALKALQAKKHAIVEKPFVTSLEEFEELKETAIANDVFVFDAITTRHMPNLTLIKSYFDAIGPVRLVTTSYSQYSSKYTDYLNGQTSSVFTKEGHGGALSDVGIYNITLAVSLFGKPAHAAYYGNMMATEVDSSGVAILDYDSFKVVALQAKDSFTENYIHIQGEKGTLIVDNDPFRFSNLRLLINKEEKVISEDTGALMGMFHEFTAFVEMVVNNDRALSNQWLNETETVIKVMNKLRESSNINYQIDHKS